MISMTPLNHETAVRVFLAHQEGESFKQVSRPELQVLRLGDALIDRVRALVPKMGNLALFTLNEPELARVSEKMLDAMQFLAKQGPALKENDLMLAACFREVCMQLGSAQCMGFAWTTFCEAVWAFPAGAKISLLVSEEADHVFVQIEFAGCRPVIVDPWIPGSKAVLLEDYFLNNPRAPAAEFRVEAVSQGLAGTPYLVQWKGFMEDFDLTQRVADALTQTASLREQEPWIAQERSQRLNSTVTNTGSPMRYEAR